MLRIRACMSGAAFGTPTSHHHAERLARVSETQGQSKAMKSVAFLD